ncbi:MAG: LapA family protein [Syntrophomonadales bacterium]
MQSYLIGALIFLIAMVVFIFQNQQPVTVTFITWVSPEVSLALVVLLAACSGALITFLVESFRRLKKMKQLREKKIKSRNRQKESMQTKDSAGV